MVSPFLTVIIPAYNEEQRIAHTIEVVIQFLKTQGYSWEIIVVDDGSEDKTATLVRQVAQDNIAITIVKSPLLKSRLFNNPRSAFVIINKTPIKESITPRI